MKKINKENAWLIIIGMLLLNAEIIFKPLYPLNDFASGVTKGLSIVVLVRFFAIMYGNGNVAKANKETDS